MNRRGHSGKTDDNHGDVVKALLAVGCSVQSLGSVGCGCPDLLVGLAGVNILVEVKDGTNIPSRQKLNDEQRKWFAFWKGQKDVAHSPEEAVEIVRRVLASEQPKEVSG